MRGKIGIFGGSFNPPHYGHLRGAESAYEELSLSCVFFVPAYIPPHKKDEKMIPVSHRINMLKMCLRDNPHFKLSAFEVKKKKVCYTVDTVRYFIHRYPQCEIILIIGSDSLNEIHTWKKWKELLALCDLAVMVRPGFPPHPPAEYKRKGRTFISRDGRRKIYLLKNPPIGISSREIRKMWLEGRSVRYLLPEDVRIYIEKRKLWRCWE